MRKERGVRNWINEFDFQANDLFKSWGNAFIVLAFSFNRDLLSSNQTERTVKDCSKIF